MRKVIGVLGRLRPICAFMLPLVLALVIVALPSLAQQIPNLTTDQILQLQQQAGPRSPGAYGNIPTGTSQTDANEIQQPDQIRNQLAVPLSRLEQIMSTRAGVQLQQFGYERFGSGASVTIPQTGAVQDDYILGAGDQIVVSLRGQENNDVRVVVDRSGQVLLPRLNPISATGRSFGSFRQDVEAAVRRAYVATNAFVSLARVRQISVLVSGEVNNPGQRLVSGLASVVDALLLSGGIKKTGTLRNVRIQRGDHSYVVDLYGMLTGRGGASSMRLADGDLVLVPALGRTVSVAGLVRQPGIFELPSGQSSMSVRTLLALAGGTEVRGNYRLSLLRIQPDGRSEFVPVAEAAAVRDSEILFAQLNASLSTNQATLSGGTGLAGSYPITAGTRLSEIIKAPGALGASPYTLFGILARRDPRTLLHTLSAFTPVAVLNGSEDMPLRTDDVIRVLSVNEIAVMNRAVRLYQARKLAREEGLRNPLTARQNQNGPDLYNPTAGSRDQFNASNQRLDQTRTANQRNQNTVSQSDDANTDLLDDTDPDNLFAQKDQNDLDRPYDSYSQSGLPIQRDSQNTANVQTGVFGHNENYSQDSANSQNFLSQQNRINDFSQRRPAQNFEDQSVPEGGFATNREVRTFRDLSRQLGVGQQVLMNFLLDHQVTLEGAVRGPGSYFVGGNVELQDLVQAAGGTLNTADRNSVELTTTAVDADNGVSITKRVSTPLRAGAMASYVVRSQDTFRFNKTYVDAGVGHVTVQGEARFTGTYDITRGERLSELLARAGGLTNVAYPNGTVFLRKSAAALERDGYLRVAKEVQEQLLTALTRIGNDKIASDTFTALQGFVSELRNQKPLGRIAIAADPSVLAAHPELDPLLESGDVIYIPQRPSTVAVLGQVMQPGSYPYRANQTIGDYIARAGGYSQSSDESHTFVVLPDGSARKIERSWLSFDAKSLPPGSTIFIPRDISPLEVRQTILDITSILSQFAVSIASLAVISKY